MLTLTDDFRISEWDLEMGSHEVADTLTCFRRKRKLIVVN